MQRVNQAVILAGGKGTRILPLSSDTPKPLLKIAGKPVMQYQIEACRASNIENIFIVIGYLGWKIKKYFGDGSKFGVKVNYILGEQEVSASILKLKQILKQKPFVLFLGDIFIKEIKLQQSINKLKYESADGVIVATRALKLEEVKKNFSIAVNAEGLVLEVIEKPKAPKDRIKGLGVYFLNRNIFSAIKRTARSPLRGEVELTDSIQTLVNSGKKVVCDIWDTWDCNITYPGDLLFCEEKLKIQPVRPQQKP